MPKDSTITYGPFEKKSPFSQEKLNVHFENKNKFLTGTRLVESVIELLKGLQYFEIFQKIINVIVSTNRRLLFEYQERWQNHSFALTNNQGNQQTGNQKYWQELNMQLYLCIGGKAKQ